jgi:hypothetical protein
MTAITEIDVVQACRTLFGKEINVSKDFLCYMQPSGVKSAYRKKAKENHPDFFATDPLHIQQKQTMLFREILRAYDVLGLFFKQREDRAWKPSGEAVREKRRSAEEKKPASASARTGEETYFSGKVPFRTLQIGQYLYYRGTITFHALIKALVWQRKQRPSFGEIALRWGWLKSEGQEKIFTLRDRPRRVGEKAVKLGLLSVFQVNVILLYQRSQQDRLGSYFVRNGTLSQQELENLVLDLKQHNAAVLANAASRVRKQNIND